MKKLWSKLLNLLNIHPDENQKWLLVSMFFSGLLITYASPEITKEIISSLPAEWIAFQALFGSISGLIIGVLWKNKTRLVAIRGFMILAIAESFAGSFWQCFFVLFITMCGCLPYVHFYTLLSYQHLLESV